MPRCMPHSHPCLLPHNALGPQAPASPRFSLHQLHWCWAPALWLFWINHECDKPLKTAEAPWLLLVNQILGSFVGVIVTSTYGMDFFKKNICTDIDGSIKIPIRKSVEVNKWQLWCNHPWDAHQYNFLPCAWLSLFMTCINCTSGLSLSYGHRHSRSFCTLWYILYFCAALSKWLVFQVLGKSDADVPLKQKKEVSLMKRGKKKKFQFTYVSCNVWVVFNVI